MIKNYNISVQKNHNLNWPYITDHPYRILIICDSQLEKAIALLNLIKNQESDMKKTYLYIKDPFELK